MATEYPGACACGKVRYRLTSAPLFVNCCHCGSCQRQTGSAFVINALIETDRIATSFADFEVTPLKSGDSGVQDIYRCPSCRTALWSDYGRRPGLRFVRVGTLEQPAAFPPQAHVFTGTKLPWVRLPQDALVFEEYFDIRQHWPAASLERLRRVVPE